mgnify:CR=1 FL=1
MKLKIYKTNPGTLEEKCLCNWTRRFRWFLHQQPSRKCTPIRKRREPWWRDLESSYWWYSFDSFFSQVQFRPWKIQGTSGWYRWRRQWSSIQTRHSPLIYAHLCSGWTCCNSFRSIRNARLIKNNLWSLNSFMFALILINNLINYYIIIRLSWSCCL